MNDIKKIVAEHIEWLNYPTKGKRANLWDADLRGADLRDANLRDADLCDADLRDADLQRANLRDANLRGADLCDANLRGADLRDADLRDANLRDADLCDADLRGADLQRANLRDAKNIPKSSQTILSILKQQKGNLIAFKYLTGDRSPYNHMLYKVGEIYETNDYNSDERFQCGAGLNVATLDWCLQDTNYNLSKTYIEVEFNAEDIVAIPYNSDGKFRVRKLRVVRELTQEELEKYIRPLFPSTEKVGAAEETK